MKKSLSACGKKNKILSSLVICVIITIISNIIAIVGIVYNTNAEFSSKLTSYNLLLSKALISNNAQELDRLSKLFYSNIFQKMTITYQDIPYISLPNANLDNLHSLISSTFSIQRFGVEIGKISYSIDTLELLFESIKSPIFYLAILILGCAYFLSAISNLARYRNVMLEYVELLKNKSLFSENSSIDISHLIATKNDPLLKEILNLYLSNLKENAEDKIRFARVSAIANTTQMLSHDIRKPFSMLKLGLQYFESAETIEEIKEFSKEFTPEINAAILSVNGMLEDIMEIGRTAEPKKTTVSVDKLIANTLKEIFKINSGAKIKLEYNLQHKYMADVEEAKINRVLSNIVGNAVQALRELGGDTIWFHTQEINLEGKELLQFTIGNNGPAILQEHLPNLFEAFFTSNKKGGTGLGLAIAKKVVTAHGGNIWCESPANSHKVEFIFTLPVVSKTVNKNNLDINLYNSAEEYKTFQPKIAGISNDENETNKSLEFNILEAENKLLEFAEYLGRKISIGILDDELVYANAVKNILVKTDKIKDKIDIHIFTEPTKTMEFALKNKLDYLICDVDLGNNELNGLDLTKGLQEIKNTPSICIHSNRSLKEDFDNAMAARARAFLPKPITKAHLFKFLVNEIAYLKSGQGKKISDKKDNNTQPTLANSANANLPLLVVVDDSDLTRISWERHVRDATVKTFAAPEIFIKYMQENKTFLQQIDILILDQNFGNESKYTGLEFAQELKLRLAFTRPIFLSSNGTFSNAEIIGKVDKVIPKEVFSFKDLKKYL